ncbi:hypothetical protein [Peribacillus loiseleuriae]|uniref:hypothetical protein n=1 Tax=Peribacillus loiseleuriae TaxID=1679170 RepID=UPI003D01931C
MNIGRMIFYDIVTGEKIVDTGQWENVMVKKTVEQQILTYKELSERNRDTFDVLELPFGAYAQDFREGILIGVDLEKKMPIFEYPNPEEPNIPIVPDKPLTDQIAELKAENTLLKVQNQALSDRADFIEDVVAEMAMTVYQ